MQTGTKVLLGVLGATVVVGGVIYFTSKKSTTTPQTTTTPNPNTVTAPNPQASLNSPCDNATKLAKIAAASANPSAERPSYDYWANLCTQSGGVPTPFPA